MKKIVITVSIVFLLIGVSIVSGASIQKIPQFKVIWRSGIIVSVLVVPTNTTTAELKSLIYEFKKARMASSLIKYIPATTPGVRDDPHQQVIIFVFSDPKWSTEEEYKKYERSSMRSRQGKSVAQKYLNNIRASYEWDKFEAKEYGSLGYDEGGMKSASYKKLF